MKHSSETGYDSDGRKYNPRITEPLLAKPDQRMKE